MGASVNIANNAQSRNADVGTDKAIELEVRPYLGYLATSNSGAGGDGNLYNVSFVVTAVSGLITATLAANSDLFSLFVPSNSKGITITSIRAHAVVTGTITTSVLFALSALVARPYTVEDSGGTALSLGGDTAQNNNVTRDAPVLTTLPSSSSASLRIATTVALTPGTRTLDTTPVGQLLGNTGTVVGTQIFGIGSNEPILLDRTFYNAYPLTLLGGEGLIIQNSLAGPATGTFQIVITIAYSTYGGNNTDVPY